MGSPLPLYRVDIPHAGLVDQLLQPASILKSPFDLWGDIIRDV